MTKPKVSFADEARAVSHSRDKSGGRCKLATWIESLPDRHAADVLDALATSRHDISSRAIAKVLLVRHSFEIAESSVQNHRNRKCCCVDR